MTSQLEQDNKRRQQIYELINKAIENCFQNPVIINKYVAPSVLEALEQANLINHSRATNEPNN